MSERAVQQCNKMLKYNIVMNMTIARQWLSKNIPEVILATVGHPLLRIGPINTRL
jgi:hypothetical protein